MAYQDVQALSVDPEFLNRIWAALSTEAAGKPNDPIGDAILKDGWKMVQSFMPLISAAPGFGAKYAADGQESIADGEILAAVQANWARVAGLYP